MKNDAIMYDIGSTSLRAGLLRILEADNNVIVSDYSAYVNKLSALRDQGGCFVAKMPKFLLKFCYYMNIFHKKILDRPLKNCYNSCITLNFFHTHIKIFCN